MKKQVQIGLAGSLHVRSLLKFKGNEITKVGKPHYRMNIGDQYLWCFTELTKHSNTSLEWWSDFERDKGWFQKLLKMTKPPAYLYIVCLNHNWAKPVPTIMILDVKQLKLFMKDRVGRYPQKIVHLSVFNQQPNDTRNILVPTRDLIDAGVVVKKYGWSLVENQWHEEIASITDDGEPTDSLDGFFADVA